MPSPFYAQDAEPMVRNLQMVKPMLFASETHDRTVFLQDRKQVW